MFNLAETVTYTTYTTTNTSSGPSALTMLVYLALVVLIIVGMWKLFEKAGHAGWKSLIPIYNTWVLLQIVGKPGWWILLFLIPFVNFVVWIVVSLDLAKVFGKSVVFAIFGLILFPYVGYLMLGFGDAKYQGGGAKPVAPAPKAPAAA